MLSSRCITPSQCLLSAAGQLVRVTPSQCLLNAAGRLLRVTLSQCLLYAAGRLVRVTPGLISPVYVFLAPALC